MECILDNDLARELKVSQPQLERVDGIRPHPTIMTVRAPSVVVRALGAPIVGLTLRKRLQRDVDQARLPPHQLRHLHVAADADMSERMSDAQDASKTRDTGCKEGIYPKQNYPMDHATNQHRYQTFSNNERHKIL
jgi:hypothetical protein